MNLTSKNNHKFFLPYKIGGLVHILTQTHRYTYITAHKGRAAQRTATQVNYRVGPNTYLCETVEPIVIFLTKLILYMYQLVIIGVFYKVYDEDISHIQKAKSSKLNFNIMYSLFILQ